MVEDSEPIGEDSPYPELADEIRREKTTRSGHIANLHVWYARTSLVESRTAVYSTMVREDHDPQATIAVAKHDLDGGVVEAARLKVLQDHVARLSIERGRDITVEQVLDARVPPPRILDMFAGGGSIPLEAMRLGSESYALDVSPVAYLIALCSIRYPQLFSRSLSTSAGTGKGGTWAGLADEILFWASWVQDRALADLATIYPEESWVPADSVTRQRPSAYLWVRTSRCPTPGCGAMVPLVSRVPLAASDGSMLALANEGLQGASLEGYELRRYPVAEGSTATSASDRVRNNAVCPTCGVHFRLTDIEQLELGSTLIGLVYEEARTGRIQYRAAENEQRRSVESAAALVPALLAGLREEGFTAPDEPLPLFQRILRERGCSSWADLFTMRQLLTLLLHAKQIAAATQAMLAARMDSDRMRALTAYLGLLLTDLARTHNVFSRWESRRRSLVTFSRGASPINFTQHYAEASPYAAPYTFMHFAARTVAAVRACAEMGRPAHVVCGSALRLPYEDEYFDAIVTDPPYYDVVPYTDLASFDYVWLRRGVGYLFPEAFGPQQPAHGEELFVASVGVGDEEHAMSSYLQRTREALEEAYRVLKADRLMTIIVRSYRSEWLQHYLDCAQQAGFSLHRVVPYTSHQSAPASQVEARSLFLTLRKDPLGTSLDHAIADAATVLQLAESGQPSLCDGLVEILLTQLTDEDIQEIIPQHYAGPSREKLGEFVMACENLESLLVSSLGSPGLRKVARARGMVSAGQPEAIAADLLRAVGFHVPLPPVTGVVSVIAELRRFGSEAEAALSLPPVQMALTSGMTRVETILKQTVWAWSRAVFVDEAEIHLEAIVQIDDADRKLDRLTMGNIVSIFRRLPDYIIRSPAADKVQKDFGRPHIYRTNKLGGKLDDLVNIRNKVQHNKEGYLDRTQFITIKADVMKALSDAARLFQQLVDEGAVPQLARPGLEIRDQYGRITVRLNMEDGTIKDIYTQRRITLGKDYYYLGQKNNPRPLDPIMIPASEVRDTIP